MTYHLHNFYAPSAAYDALAREEGIPLVRNDLLFQPFVENGTISHYVLDDHWHPNAQGYTLIAKHALDVIEQKHLLHTSSQIGRAI